MCQQIVDFDSQIVFWISICCNQKPVEMDGEMELLPPKWIKIHRVGEGLHMVGSIHCLLCEGCARVWCGVDMLHDLFSP